MAVNFTTNVGLAKPTEAELALNWTRVEDLQEDNNTIIEAHANIDLSPYTPTLTAATTAPTLGTGGSAVGEYRILNEFILGTFKLAFGTTPGAGTGIWGFALPFAADNSFHVVGSSLTTGFGDNDIIGTGYMFDATSTDASGPAALDVVTISAVSYVRFLIGAYVGKATHAYSPGNPFTVASTDTFTGSFAYKRA